MSGNYFVYILTNTNNTVLYTGMTNDLEPRLIEHYLAKGIEKTFAGRYFCYNLLYYERHNSPQSEIERERKSKIGIERRRKNSSIILIPHGNS